MDVLLLLTGEAMEKGLRECCRSIRIGKVLIKVEEETNKPTVCLLCTFIGVLFYPFGKISACSNPLVPKKYQFRIQQQSLGT